MLSTGLHFASESTSKLAAAAKRIRRWIIGIPQPNVTSRRACLVPKVQELRGPSGPFAPHLSYCFIDFFWAGAALAK